MFNFVRRGGRSTKGRVTSPRPFRERQSARGKKRGSEKASGLFGEIYGRAGGQRREGVRAKWMGREDK